MPQATNSKVIYFYQITKCQGLSNPAIQFFPLKSSYLKASLQSPQLAVLVYWITIQVSIGYCLCGGLVWQSCDTCITFGSKTQRPQPEGFLNGQEVSLAVFFSASLSLSVFVMALSFNKARRMCDVF